MSALSPSLEIFLCSENVLVAESWMSQGHKPGFSVYFRYSPQKKKKKLIGSSADVRRVTRDA